MKKRPKENCVHLYETELDLKQRNHEERRVTHTGTVRDRLMSTCVMAHVMFDYDGVALTS